ncbi:MAG: GH25 family lysozyme [Erysipelotrichaceae bacterium]|nr:GH25 family lysozyme [Erysipelotrichaceae bacterium]
MAVYGIDISEHNGEIDLSEYKDQFVIIRAGWGWSIDQKDRQFERNVRECVRLNIPFGVYWYSYAVDEETAKQEAEVFLEVIRPYKEKISMGVWVDQEDADGWKVKNGFKINKEYISKITSLMCAMIRREGFHTGIYCSYSWLKYLDRSCAFYDRWVAHWGTNDGTKQQDISSVCSIHQYTSVPVDRDFCSKSPDHFRFSQKQIL